MKGPILVYIICPVNNCSEELKKKLDDYVSNLESTKRYRCHYPPRDVKQDMEGLFIVVNHLIAIKKCSLVHVWWDPDSKGSHTDLGMAIALEKPIKLINKDELSKDEFKSYKNVLFQFDHTYNSRYGDLPWGSYELMIDMMSEYGYNIQNGMVTKLDRNQYWCWDLECGIGWRVDKPNCIISFSGLKK